MNFRFHSHESFLILWLLPILTISAIVVWRQQSQRVYRSFGLRLAKFLTSSVSNSRRTTKLILEMIVIALMVIALARPQQGEGKQEVKSQGVELIIALDVSNSMLAEDDKPSRLEHAKRNIHRLLDQISGDKVGVMAFAGSAVLVAPLTSDYSAVRMFVDSLTTESVSSQGTSFKKVIEMAKDAFQRGGLSEEEGSRITRVLLIATDGEDHEEGAVKLAAKYSSSSNLRIFTLGFGTAKGAPIPTRDQYGNLQGYKKDKAGQVVITTVNDSALEQLARAGRGSYNHATFSGEEMASIRADLDRLEKSEFDSQIMTTYNEKFQPFLVAALLLGFLEIVFGERRAGGRVWRGRFEVSEQ